MTASAAPVPQREPAEVFAVRRTGRYTELTLVAPRIAATARPGQLVMAAVGGPASALVLRRALAVADVRHGAGRAGTCTVVIAGSGPGSSWLGGRQPGDVVELLGPVGRPFPLPDRPRAAVVLAYEHRAAAMTALAHDLVAAGCQVDVVLGANTAERLYGETALKRLARQVVTTTVDGSAGEPLSFEDIVRALLRHRRPEVVYGWLPVELTAAVGARVAAAADPPVPSQFLVETPAPCGIGICGACDVPLLAGAALACSAGPVFPGSAVDWGVLADSGVDAAPVGTGAVSWPI